MDEELIELVREHEALYNNKCARYSDSKFKDQVWKNIGMKLNKRGIDCKHRWISLRDQYRKVLKARNNQAPPAPQGPWKYENLMAFLKRYMRSKNRNTSINIDICADTNIKEELQDKLRTNENGDNIDITEHDIELPTTSTVRKKNITHHTTSTAATTVSAELLKYILKSKDEERSKKDSLDLFFETMKETVKTFSPKDQYFLKHNIFNMVSEVESKYINTTQHNATLQQEEL